MYIQRVPLVVVTDGSGNAVAYTDVLTGELSAIHYVKGDYVNGVDFSITLEATGEVLWSESDVNASASRAPRQPTHTTLGAAALFAGGGSPILEPIGIAKDRIKVTLAQGGSGKTGTFHFVLR